MTKTSVIFISVLTKKPLPTNDKNNKRNTYNITTYIRIKITTQCKAPIKHIFDMTLFSLFIPLNFYIVLTLQNKV